METQSLKSDMRFEIVETMGMPTDSMIAFAARVSHGGSSAVRTDYNLVKALRDSDHFSPFSHINFSLFINCRSEWERNSPVLVAVKKYLLGGLHTKYGGHELYESPFSLMRNVGGGHVGLMRLSLIHLLKLLEHTSFGSMYTTSGGGIVPHGYCDFPQTAPHEACDIHDERFAVWYIPRLIARKILDGSDVGYAFIDKNSAIREELNGYVKELDSSTFGYDESMSIRLNTCNKTFLGGHHSSKSEKMVIWASDVKTPNVLMPTDYNTLGFIQTTALDQMQTVTFKVDNMPLYIANQFLRHRRGVCVSQMSGRYSSFGTFVGDDEGVGLLKTWLDLDTWRVTARKADARAAPLVDWSEENAAVARQGVIDGMNHVLMNAILLESRCGVAKECVREVLPLGAHTKMVITMTMEAVKRVVGLRGDDMAQKEWGTFVEFLTGVLIKHDEMYYGSEGSE